jgi:hypothetical protein
MRYNPATESSARSLDTLAAESRSWMTKPEPVKALRPTWSSDDVFATGTCHTWVICMRYNPDQGFRARMQQNLNRDMHRAMHHRPHQPEF